MERTKMTIEEFIKQDIDIDVYDTMTDDIGIAFVGPQELTDAGREHFAPVLAMEIEVKDAPGWGLTAYVNIDGDDWKKKLRQAKEFFYTAAGYGSAADYEKWFKE